MELVVKLRHTFVTVFLLAISKLRLFIRLLRAGKFPLEKYFERETYLFGSRNRILYMCFSINQCYIFFKWNRRYKMMPCWVMSILKWTIVMVTSVGSRVFCGAYYSEIWGTIKCKSICKLSVKIPISTNVYCKSRLNWFSSYFRGIIK